MVVSIDNGNKQTKTGRGAVFTSGLSVSTTMPGFGSDILHWKDKYYMLSSKRGAYLRNKTTNDDCFVLTLYGIAKDLIASGVRSGTGQTIPITLLVGLPPAHYGAQYKSFRSYFLNRGPIEFALDGQEFRIHIDDCKVYVQGFGALMSVYGQVRNLSNAVVVDMGGFTLDYLPVRSGAPCVAECGSLDDGVIKLYNKVLSRCNGELDLLLSEDDVDAVLQNCQSDLPGEVKQLMRAAAAEYVDDIVSRLRERDIDLRISRPILSAAAQCCSKTTSTGTSASAPRLLWLTTSPQTLRAIRLCIAAKIRQCKEAWLWECISASGAPTPSNDTRTTSSR